MKYEKIIFLWGFKYICAKYNNNYYKDMEWHREEKHSIAHA